MEKTQEKITEYFVSSPKAGDGPTAPTAELTKTPTKQGNLSIYSNQRLTNSIVPYPGRSDFQKTNLSICSIYFIIMHKK